MRQWPEDYHLRYFPGRSRLKTCSVCLRKFMLVFWLSVLSSKNIQNLFPSMCVCVCVCHHRNFTLDMHMLSDHVYDLIIMRFDACPTAPGPLIANVEPPRTLAGAVLIETVAVIEYQRLSETAG